MKEQLNQLGYSSYKAYREGPEWAATKRRYRASKRLKCCRICKNPRYELHHKTYIRLGRENLSDLIPLCRTHHQSLHDYLPKQLGVEQVTKAYLTQSHGRISKQEKALMYMGCPTCRVGKGEWCKSVNTGKPLKRLHGNRLCAVKRLSSGLRKKY